MLILRWKHLCFKTIRDAIPIFRCNLLFVAHATMDPPSWVRPVEKEDRMAQMDSEDGSEVTPTC